MDFFISGCLLWACDRGAEQFRLPLLSPLEPLWCSLREHIVTCEGRILPLYYFDILILRRGHELLLLLLSHSSITSSCQFIFGYKYTLSIDHLRNGRFGKNLYIKFLPQISVQQSCQCTYIKTTRAHRIYL